MARKDFSNNENKDRRSEDDKTSPAINKANDNKDADGKEQTEVKNAHASGLGSMGRNDEKLSDGDEKQKEENY